MQRSSQIVGLSGLLLTFALSSAAVAQGGHPSTQPGVEQNDVSMIDQLAELRAKVARLEASLNHNHQGPSGHGNAALNHPGMAGPMGMDGMDMGPGMGSGTGTAKGPMGGMSSMGDKGMMGMGGSQGMSAMKPGPSNGMGMGGTQMGMGQTGGMKMMGMMKGAGGPQGMAMNSALPGFPGASHIYHIGASGFFLDHSEHLQLTPDQQAALNRSKQKSLLAQNTADRDIQEAEQQLWELTAADEPNAALIEKKVREIEKLRGDQRLGFIRAVGEAADVLTADQRQALLGQGPQQSVKAME
jgi:Spy/CpxP family protein refolding chaperone